MTVRRRQWRNNTQKDRLDRHGPHGLSHGRAPAQGRLRRLDLEPHARQGRAAGGQGRQGRRSTCRTSKGSTCCSRSCRPARTSTRSCSARTASPAQGGTVPKIVVDCSTIAVEESASIRDRLKQLGSDFVAAPISGNAKVIKAGRLSAVHLRRRGRVQDRDADDGGDRAAGRRPMSAKASSRASARSRTTSCSAW